ncbi:MAG: gamma-glutamylcyclotransferase [Bacillota bacterium]
MFRRLSIKGEILVFVYGTLRQHEHNCHLMEGAKCYSKQSWTHGILYDTRNGYPAMGCDDSQRVYGELYEITKEQLQQLDSLEGHIGLNTKNHYQRIVQTVFTDQRSYENVFVYVYEKTVNLTKIEFGDWKCHRYLNQDKLLYFAYGSCMDNERFNLAKVDHLFKDIKGCGRANNFSLAYTRKSTDGGRADLLESENTVEGKVFEIIQEGLYYLYRREGVQSAI